MNRLQKKGKIIEIKNNLQGEITVKFNGTQKTVNTKPAKLIVKEIAENTLVDAKELVDDTALTLKEEKEQKFETSKQHIQDAIDELEYIHNEVWNNFPEIYSLTKNLNDEMKSYYSTHDTISKIAAGKIESWKDITTGKDAALLVSDILLEATYNPEPNEAHISQMDGYVSINRGELDVINKVLDELENINDETKAVADIYRKELEIAEEKSIRNSSKFSMEALLSRENNYDTHITPNGKEIKVFLGLTGEELKNSYIDNADKIEEQAKEIEYAKSAYEAAKADFLNNNYTGRQRTSKLEDLQNKLDSFYTACSRQVNGSDKGALDGWLVEPYIVISSSNADTTIDNTAQKVADLLDIDKELFIRPEKIKEPKGTSTSESTASTGIVISTATGTGFEYHHNNSGIY